MWNRPDDFLSLVGDTAWEAHKRIRKTELNLNVSSEADERAVQLLWSLIEPIVAFRSEVLPTHAPDEFLELVHSSCMDGLKLFKEAKDFRLLGTLWLASNWLTDADKGIGTLSQVVVGGIQALLGSETKFLVGTRGGRAAFRELFPPLKTRDDYKAILSGYGPGSDSQYLDATDVWLVPLWPDFVDVKRLLSIPGADYPTAKLLEDAYYRQRYTVHPMGVEVELRHLEPLTRLTLKVKPGLHDPNYIDFLAQFSIEVPDIMGKKIKSGFVALDGAFAVGEIGVVGPVDERFNSYLYLLWIVAMIYHDLVTAKEIKVASPQSAGLSRAKPKGNQQPSWVYIPRKIKRRELSPRLPLQTSRNMTPHHVTGHLRKGSLTLEHRIELERFEAETGFRVLDLLAQNPGHTFVRPHVSPTFEDVRSLPRFIHARLQSEIDRMMDPKWRQ